MRGRILLVYLSILVVGIGVYFAFVYVFYDDVGDKITHKDSIKSPKTEALEAKTSQSKTIESSDIIAPEIIEIIETPEISESNESSEIQSNIPESSEVIKPKSYIVNVNIANIRALPSTDSEIIAQIKENEEVKIIREENGWGELEGGGFIFMELLR